MATQISPGLQSPITLNESSGAFDNSHISSAMDISGISNKSSKPPSSTKSSTHKKSMSHGSPNSFHTAGSNSSKRNSLQSSLTTTTQATTVSGLSKNSIKSHNNGHKSTCDIHGKGWNGVKTAFASTGNLFAPTPAPRSFATVNTGSTVPTQNSTVFSSSFFSASTSHLDDDLTSQVASATSSSSRLPFLRSAQPEPQSAQTFHALDLDSSHSSSLHAHRLNHNQSKLPTFRFADLTPGKSLLSGLTATSSLALVNEVVRIPPSTAVTRSSTANKSHRRGKSENIPPKNPVLIESVTAPIVSGSLEPRTVPTVVTTVSASTSAPSLPLATSLTPYSAPHKLQSVLKRPTREREPQSSYRSKESVISREPTTERSSSQAQKSQPPSASKTVQVVTQSQTNQNTRVRSSTSSLEPTKQPAPILVGSKRPASFPTSPRATQVTFVEPTVLTSQEVPPTTSKASNQRSYVSSSTIDSGVRAPPVSLRSHRVQAAVESASTGTNTKAEHSHTPTSADRASSRDRSNVSSQTQGASEDRRNSASSVSRPPVSYKPTPPSPSTTSSTGSTSGSTRVPPIRGFRSSGTRKSLTLETAVTIALPNDDDNDLSIEPTSSTNPTQSATRDQPPKTTEVPAESNNVQKNSTQSDTQSSTRTLQIMPPADHSSDEPTAQPDPDDTGDLFLKIARFESGASNGRTSSAAAYEDVGLFSDDQKQSHALKRVSRASHRRPLSTVIPAYSVPQSPPRISRRLSDQQETTSRSRVRGKDGQSTNVPPRTFNYRSLARDVNFSAASVVGDNSGCRSPVAPRSHTSAGSRSLVFHDTHPSDGPQYTSRKPSISEGISIVTSSSQNLKSGTAYHQRTYNSSPLAPRNNIEQHLPSTQQILAGQSHAQANQSDNVAQEGTDSTTSTGGPSTVWDELDELKHRIHRLELTGKLPNSSSSAMSRVSDDRPPTAHTAATTNSGSSPKRPTTTGLLSNSGPNANNNTTASATGNDNVSTTSSQREAPNLLQAALAQVKPGVSNEVFRALELASTDALALSTLLGSVGQPGPISSGASAIGLGGAQTVTDRQLRRKAEGVVRSLTELCIALSTESNQRPVNINGMVSIENSQDTPISPITIKGFSSIMTQRRSNTGLDQSPAYIPSSPHALSKFEERRNKLLNSPAIPSPRFSANSPSGQTVSRPPPVPENQHLAQGRKSSMFLSRRRAETEEPEELSGRKTSMLRTRRAGTEEPEEPTGRKTALLLRGHRGIGGSDDDEPRIRAPSRAITEIVHSGRPSTRGGEYGANVPIQSIEGGNSSSSINNKAPSASRRRMMSSRLSGVPPQSGMPTPRRFLERQTSDRDGPSAVEKVQGEERSQRLLSMGSHPAMIARTHSVSRRAQARER